MKTIHLIQFIHLNQFPIPLVCLVCGQYMIQKTITLQIFDYIKL